MANEDTIEFNDRPDDDGHFSTDPDSALERLDPPETGLGSVTKQQAAVAMLVRSASYTEIAETLNYATPAHARAACEAMLATLANTDKVAWTTQRQIANLRLEKLLASVWDRATDDGDDEQLAYHRAGLNVIDRLAKLNGLDAPTQHVIYSPDASEFDSVITQVLAKSRVNQEQEGDIFALAEDDEIVIEPGDLDEELPQ